MMKLNSHHFLLISFPFQSHINPILQLGKNLARAGAKVTFATTVLGLLRLRNSLPVLEGLSYTSFSDGHDQENTQSGGNFVTYLDSLRCAGSKDLTKIIQSSRDEDQPVTCLVYSLLFPWAAAVAREAHVPSAFLSIQCATVFAIYHHFFKDHGFSLNREIDSPASVSIPGSPDFCSSDLPSFLLSVDGVRHFMIPILQEHMQELEKEREPLVLINSFKELESEAIKTLGMSLNVIPIGPLVPSAFSSGKNSKDRSFGGSLFRESEDYMKWLDSKAEDSVIYVAFGSLVVMKKEEKVEILYGLVESKRPFMWVMRSTDGDEEKEMKEMLENEVSSDGCGIIVPWCSQIEVLNHKSIGCFVTHCGWNSTLESLISGVPVVGLPHNADQMTNAKMLEEVWGTGVRARTNGSIKMTGEELVKRLDTVMGDGDRGKLIRLNTGKWRGLALEAVTEGGSTFNNLKSLLENSQLNSN